MDALAIGRLPDFCYRCDKLDHSESACPKAEELDTKTVPMKKTLESWFRADSLVKMKPARKRGSLIQIDHIIMTTGLLLSTTYPTHWLERRALTMPLASP